MISLTAEKALEAYGGKQLWAKAKYIEAAVILFAININNTNGNNCNKAQIKIDPFL